MAIFQFINLLLTIYTKNIQKVCHASNVIITSKSFVIKYISQISFTVIKFTTINNLLDKGDVVSNKLISACGVDSFE